MADRVLLSDGLGSAVAVGGGKQIFTDEPLDVAGVARNLLISNSVVWSVNPIFRVTTHVSVYYFVLVDSWHKIGTV